MTYTIHDAAADDDIIAVGEMLTQDKSLINSADGSGWTPLHYAVAGNHTDMAKFLIGKGADINARSLTDGKTPLHWAAFYGHLPAVQLMVDMGANLNARDDDGYTVLNMAEETELRNLIQYIRDHGGI